MCVHQAQSQHLYTDIDPGDAEALLEKACMVQPLSLGRSDVARKYEAMLINFPNLLVADLNRDVIRQASRLRADYRIRPPDALQAAACLVHGAGGFVTSDNRLKQIQNELAVIILDDFIEADMPE